MRAVGMYASVRGWLEMDFAQREAAERIIERNRHELYSGGWAFPVKPFNWSLYLFYGGDIRQGELPWFRGQVEQLARMSPVDEDGDRPRGLFVVTREEHEGASMWRVGAATVTELPAPALSWLGE
jgi:hypothetical protein